MSNDMVKIHITVDTGFSGASHEDEIEVSRAEWEAMTAEERDDFMAPEIDATASTAAKRSSDAATEPGSATPSETPTAAPGAASPASSTRRHRPDPTTDSPPPTPMLSPMFRRP